MIKSLSPDGKSTVLVAAISAVSAVVTALITAMVAIYSLPSEVRTARTSLDEAVIEAQSVKGDARTPIGSVVSSMLDPARFSEVAGDPPSFDPTVTKWVPADGLLAIGRSTYGRMFGVETTPDLRGVFIRGLNTFDSSKPGRTDEFSDSESGRNAGSLQSDSLASHSHSGTYRGFHPKGGGGPDHTNLMAYGGTVDVQFQLIADGGAETRPKNASLYFYLRIN